MIPKTRIDALTDGVFAFAMTLLVLDLHLPDDFDPSTPGALLGALMGLRSQLIAYGISFFVLGMRWLGQARNRGVPETTSNTYAMWVLIYLFLITCMPFSTMVVGRYEDLAPSVWLYGANLLLSALASLRMSLLAEEEANQPSDRGSRIDQLVLIASAVLSIAISFISPPHATLAYLLNVGPILARRFTKPASVGDTADKAN